MHKIHKKLLILFPSLAILAACNAKTLTLLNPSSGYVLKSDVFYQKNSTNPKHQVDIYLPKTQTKQPPKVVIFWHGGSWRNGDKAEYGFVGQAFAARGFIALIANYRLYPEVQFPAFMQDAAQLVTWAQQNITQYGGDHTAIYLMGHSAGAQIATLVATNTEFLSQAGGDPQRIAGVIGVAGPYDFLPSNDPDIQPIFAPAMVALTTENPQNPALPVDYVSKNTPKMLLLWGEKDQTVWRKNIVNLSNILQKNQVVFEAKFYPKQAHIDILVALGSRFTWVAPTLRDAINFMSQ